MHDESKLDLSPKVDVMNFVEVLKEKNAENWLNYYKTSM